MSNQPKFRQGIVIRRHLSDRPDWQILRDEIPIGTKYIVVGEPIELKLKNDELNEERQVMCYYVIGNGKRGYMVADVLQIEDIK